MFRAWNVSAGVCLMSVLIAGGPAGSAETSPATLTMKPVLELFTSQGCSSCPPADALLKSYVDGGKVIALSMPVDYWDYLGWKDSLASPAFSSRQRDYAKARGDNMVYTPQIIVNGMTHAVGSHKGEIDQAIEATERKLETQHVPLRVSLSNGKLTVEVGSAPAGAGGPGATLWLAMLRPTVEVAIDRGENSGRKIIYSNVVHDWSQLGTWNGSKAVFERELSDAGDSTACAVLLQVGKSGPIIGAAEIRNLPLSAASSRATASQIGTVK